MKKMKKFLLVLCLALCVFGLTACGNAAAEEKLSFTAADLEPSISEMLETINGYVSAGMADVIIEQVKSQGSVEEVAQYEDIFNVWSSSLEEIGEYQGFVDGSFAIEGTDEDFTCKAELKGTIRNADIEIYFTNGANKLPTMMISPQYTMGEKMEKAGLNTLLGMGTVFSVLILIMVIIYAFGVIPKIEKAIADKKAGKTQASQTEKSVDNTIAQIIENEELSDDTELVAVIAAAIAAYEGSASTDGFVVRSIKRANTNKWQRA